MAAVSPGRQFGEAAAEWGLDEVTEEDALWACPPKRGDEDRPGWWRSEVGFGRSEEALLDMARPGRWDRW